jgi:hypothetical protein
VASAWIANKFGKTTEIHSEQGNFLIWIAPSGTKQVEIRLPFEDNYSFVGACTENAFAFAQAISKGLLGVIAKQLGTEEEHGPNMEEVLALSVLAQVSGLEGSHIYTKAGGDNTACVLCGNSSRTVPCAKRIKLAEERTSIEVVTEKEIRILIRGAQTFGCGGYSVSFEHLNGPEPEIVAGSEQTNNNGFVDSTTALVRFQAGTVVRVVEEDAIGDGRVLMDKTYVSI